MQKSRVKGSLTVEAAFVVPIVLFTVLFVIQAALYLKEKELVRRELQTILLELAAELSDPVRAGATKLEKGASAQVLRLGNRMTEEEASERIQRRLAACMEECRYLRVTESVIETGTYTVSAKVTLRTERLLLPIGKALAAQVFGTTLYVKEGGWKREELGRISLVVVRTGERIKGLGDLLAKLSGKE